MSDDSRLGLELISETVIVSVSGSPAVEKCFSHEAPEVDDADRQVSSTDAFLVVDPLLKPLVVGDDAELERRNLAITNNPVMDEVSSQSSLSDKLVVVDSLQAEERGHIGDGYSREIGDADDLTSKLGRKETNNSDLSCVSSHSFLTEKHVVELESQKQDDSEEADIAGSVSFSSSDHSRSLCSEHNEDNDPCVEDKVSCGIAEKCSNSDAVPTTSISLNIGTNFRKDECLTIETESAVSFDTSKTAVEEPCEDCDKSTATDDSLNVFPTDFTIGDEFNFFPQADSKTNSNAEFLSSSLANRENKNSYNLSVTSSASLNSERISNLSSSPIHGVDEDETDEDETQSHVPSKKNVFNRCDDYKLNMKVYVKIERLKMPIATVRTKVRDQSVHTSNAYSCPFVDCHDDSVDCHDDSSVTSNSSLLNKYNRTEFSDHFDDSCNVSNSSRSGSVKSKKIVNSFKDSVIPIAGSVQADKKASSKKKRKLREEKSHVRKKSKSVSEDTLIFNSMSITSASSTYEKSSEERVVECPVSGTSPASTLNESSEEHFVDFPVSVKSPASTHRKSSEEHVVECPVSGTSPASTLVESSEEHFVDFPVSIKSPASTHRKSSEEHVLEYPVSGTSPASTRGESLEEHVVDFPVAVGQELSEKITCVHIPSSPQSSINETLPEERSEECCTVIYPQKMHEISTSPVAVTSHLDDRSESTSMSKGVGKWISFASNSRYQPFVKLVRLPLELFQSFIANQEIGMRKRHVSKNSDVESSNFDIMNYTASARGHAKHKDRFEKSSNKSQSNSTKKNRKRKIVESDDSDSQSSQLMGKHAKSVTSSGDNWKLERLKESMKKAFDKKTKIDSDLDQIDSTEQSSKDWQHETSDKKNASHSELLSDSGAKGMKSDENLVVRAEMGVKAAPDHKETKRKNDRLECSSKLISDVTDLKPVEVENIKSGNNSICDSDVNRKSAKDTARNISISKDTKSHMTDSTKVIKSDKVHSVEEEKKKNPKDRKVAGFVIPKVAKRPDSQLDCNSESPLAVLEVHRKAPEEHKRKPNQSTPNLARHFQPKPIQRTPTTTTVSSNRPPPKTQTQMKLCDSSSLSVLDAIEKHPGYIGKLVPDKKPIASGSNSDVRLGAGVRPLLAEQPQRLPSGAPIPTITGRRVDRSSEVPVADVALRPPDQFFLSSTPTVPSASSCHQPIYMLPDSSSSLSGTPMSRFGVTPLDASHHKTPSSSFADQDSNLFSFEDSPELSDTSSPHLTFKTPINVMQTTTPGPSATSLSLIPGSGVMTNSYLNATPQADVPLLPVGAPPEAYPHIGMLPDSQAFNILIRTAPPPVHIPLVGYNPNSYPQADIIPRSPQVGLSTNQCLTPAINASPAVVVPDNCALPPVLARKPPLLPTPVEPPSASSTVHPHSIGSKGLQDSNTTRAPLLGRAPPLCGDRPSLLGSGPSTSDGSKQKDNLLKGLGDLLSQFGELQHLPADDDDSELELDNYIGPLSEACLQIAEGKPLSPRFHDHLQKLMDKLTKSLDESSGPVTVSNCDRSSDVPCNQKPNSKPIPSLLDLDFSSGYGVSQPTKPKSNVTAHSLNNTRPSSEAVSDHQITQAASEIVDRLLQPRPREVAQSMDASSNNEFRNSITDQLMELFVASGCSRESAHNLISTAQSMCLPTSESTSKSPSYGDLVSPSVSVRGNSIVGSSTISNVNFIEPVHLPGEHFPNRMNNFSHTSGPIATPLNHDITTPLPSAARQEILSPLLGTGFHELQARRENSMDSIRLGLVPNTGQKYGGVEDVSLTYVGSNVNSQLPGKIVQSPINSDTVSRQDSGVGMTNPNAIFGDTDHRSYRSGSRDSDIVSTSLPLTASDILAKKIHDEIQLCDVLVKIQSELAGIYDLVADESQSPSDKDLDTCNVDLPENLSLSFMGKDFSSSVPKPPGSGAKLPDIDAIFDSVAIVNSSSATSRQSPTVNTLLLSRNDNLVKTKTSSNASSSAYINPKTLPCPLTSPMSEASSSQSSLKLTDTNLKPLLHTSETKDQSLYEPYSPSQNIDFESPVYVAGGDCRAIKKKGKPDEVVKKAHCDQSTPAEIGNTSESGEPNSLSKKEKGSGTLSKKAAEDIIISMSRAALKPHYHSGRITPQEYKEIMKKAISKIGAKTTGDVSEKRVVKFINAYVEKIIMDRK